MGAKKDKLRRGKEKPKPKRRKVEKRVHRRRKDDIELYCVCRQTWDGNSLMVQCDQCQGWFHPKCVGVSTKEAKDMPFVCPSCQDKPILNLINYQMGSFNKKIQHSYYESIDPKRLYQMYSIPDISKYQNPTATTTSTFAADEHIQHILNKDELSEIHQKVLSQMNEMNETKQMDQTHSISETDNNETTTTSSKLESTSTMEVSHSETIMDCHRYLLSVLFAKQLDLQQSISESRPFVIHKLITDEAVREHLNHDIASSILSKHQQMSNRVSSSNSSNHHHHSHSHAQYSINDQFSISTDNHIAADSASDLHLQFTRNLYHDPSADIKTDCDGFTESKRIQNNMASYTTIDIDTIMCPQCNGQIPSHFYTKHLVSCYSATHCYYEQDMRLNVNHYGSYDAKGRRSRFRRKRTFSEMVKVDELLFSTPYKAECVPPNPLELKLEEQSESDIEAVSALCPPDINDRKKVVAQLIRRQNRFSNTKRSTLKSKGSPPSERKELEVFHKIFTKMVPKEEFSSSPSTDTDSVDKVHGTPSNAKMEESEDLEDEEDTDSDDDKPIALNLKNQSKSVSGATSPKSPNTYNLRTRSPPKSALQMPSVRETPQSERSASISSNQHSDSVQSTASPLNSRMTKQEKYKEEYREMHRTFKAYYRDHRVRERKRRQRMEMRSKRNADKLVADMFGRESQQFERDRAELDRLYGYLQRESRAMGQRTPFTRYPLSMRYSKDLLDLMLKFRVRTKHCGFVHDEPRRHRVDDKDTVGKVEGEEEQKTMRMTVEKEEADDHEMNDDRDDEDGKKGDGNKAESLEFEHYCRLKVGKNGTCRVHGEWRRKRYEELVSKMKREIEGIFIMKCALRHSQGLLEESAEQMESMKRDRDKFAAKELCAGKYDLIGYFSTEEVIDPAVSIQVNPAQTDVDALLQSRFSSAIHPPTVTVDDVARNAIVYPVH